ncbi:hypothetical protein [Arenibacterium halophilum]|uniref:Uncharacterized protein n=1 Tax=Arenibacterium halophilum TaxID=2583821 RepID=A0ABY2WY15_9RHOB|nr:hypothetical protein [Arenibacterium halophilum]TMV07318.1 hypothetical protein FGK64_21950 [Arenibacterium halophilum]
MALSFPLAKDEFVGTFKLLGSTFELGRQRVVSNLTGGEIRTAEVAPALWEGQMVIASLPHAAGADLAGLLAALEVPGRSFQIYRRSTLSGPVYDPRGALLSGYTPVIEEFHATDAERLRLSGFPPGYQLAAGDMLGFDYNPGGGTRRALHQVVQGRNADGTGEMQSFITVAPAIRTGAILGTEVDLIRPHCNAVLVPGSVNTGRIAPAVRTGMSFSWRQSLR